MKKFTDLLFFPFLFLIVFIGNRFYFRHDLTQDKKYSIQTVTKELLNKLEEEVFVDIYLDGTLPSDLIHLQQSIKDFFEEINAHAAKFKVVYKFIDLDNLSDEERATRIKSLRKHNISLTNFQFKEKNKTLEKNIYPAAIFKYKDKESAIFLLKSKHIADLSQMVASSIDSLEYEFSNVLEKLLSSFSIKVALLRSHGSPSDASLAGFIEMARENYQYFDLYLSGKDLIDTSDYDAIVIVKPLEEFSEDQKYVLDQYIMSGGKLLFFIDALTIDMASIYSNQSFGVPLNTGLEELIFKYGVRVNLDLIQDFQCSLHPFIVGNLGNQPQLQLLQWPFSPIITYFPEHAVTKNIDAVSTQFISSLSATKVKDVEQFAIMYTSQYTMTAMAPIFLNLEKLRTPPNQNDFNQGHIPIACILKGEFDSAYKSEIMLPEVADKSTFIAKSPKNKIFVASTSSLIMNNVDVSGRKHITWGYDPFLNKQFANKEFVINLLKYMLSENGVISMKSRINTVRFLDKAKVSIHRTSIQIFAIVVPIFILLIFGLIWNYFYRKKYVK